MNKNLLYRSIPKVDILLADEGIKVLIETYSRESVMEAIHSEMEKLRAFIGVCEEEEKAKQQIALLNENIAKAVSAMHTPNMKKVINGTGTILHTNLGRAPISFEHMMRAAEIVSGYSNLEYNLEAGRRGERYSHFEKLLCKLTGAEAAMAVNNNASSVLLILSSLAKGGEVIVSRGELIEIGGKFRIPDVMEQSGANLVEVGTTNKTHYEDYEEAITEETKALLKVHTSNYRIVGFTESVGIDELVPIAKEHGIPVVEDLAAVIDPNLSSYDKLLFLNHELFYMIETSVDIHLLAYLYSSQLITKDKKSLSDKKRIYFKWLTEIMEEGLAKGEFKSTSTAAELMDIYAMYERGRIFPPSIFSFRSLCCLLAQGILR